MNNYFVKLVSTIIFYLLLSNAFAQQWECINPKPQGGNLKAIQFPTATTGYAVGDAGTVIKTTDTGATWIVIQKSLTTNLKKSLRRRV